MPSMSSSEEEGCYAPPGFVQGLGEDGKMEKTTLRVLTEGVRKMTKDQHEVGSRGDNLDDSLSNGRCSPADDDQDSSLLVDGQVTSSSDEYYPPLRRKDGPHFNRHGHGGGKRERNSSSASDSSDDNGVVKWVTPPSLKIIQSLAIYYSTFTYGCGYTFLAPAVIALSRQLDSDVSQVSRVFIILTMSYSCSALLCGALFNVLHRQFMMVTVILCMATPMFIIPYITNIRAFYILGGLLGAGCGGYDVGHNAGIIEIWRGRAAVFILIQHFAYSLGTIVPPLILAPFLPQDHQKGSLATGNGPGLGEPKLIIPFTVAGSMIGFGALIHVALGFKQWAVRRASKFALESKTFFDSPDMEESRPLIKNGDKKDQAVNGVISNLNRTEENVKVSDQISFWHRFRASCDRRTVILTLLSCAVIGPYGGLEVLSMDFMPTFSVFSTVHLTEFQGTRVLFALTLAYSIGRGLGIFLVLRYPPERLLAGNLILVLTSNTILMVAGQYHEAWLWVSCVGLGLGLSTIFPAYYSYIEQFFFVSHSVVSAITVSDGVLASIYPLIVGSFIEHTPAVLTWVNYFNLGVLCMSFLLVYWVTRNKTRK